MSCEVCGQSENLKSCARCLQVTYCSREHQITHWKVHRRTCKKTIQPQQSTTNSQDEATTTATTNISMPAFTTNYNVTTNGNQAEESINCYRNGQSTLIPVTIDAADGGDGGGGGGARGGGGGKSGNNGDSSQTQQGQLTINDCDMLPNSFTQNFTNQNTTSNGGGGVNSFESQMSTPKLNHGAYLFNMIQQMSGNYPINTVNVMSPQFVPTENYQITALRRIPTFCKVILEDMRKYGFCVIDNFLTENEVVLSEVMNLYKLGVFTEGQVVKAHSNSKLIRGDQITWIEGSEPMCHHIGFLIRVLDTIITRCTTTMAIDEFCTHTITDRTRAMIACYPGNYAKYVRHIDNPNQDGRCITSIYYLNKNYVKEEHGGLLRLFPHANPHTQLSVADIEPKFNRVIFFWSDRRNPHEVMPSTRTRFAITVWYFDAEEREKALERLNVHVPQDKKLVPFIYD